MGEECYNCGKTGHFGNVCRSRKIRGRQQGKSGGRPTDKQCKKPKEQAHTVDNWSSDDEYAHLVSTVTEELISTATDSSPDTWWANIEVGRHPLRMQIDTGAAQSLIPYKAFQKLNLSPKHLAMTDRKFQSYTQHPIEVKGRITLPTKFKGMAVDIQYYVVDVNQKPLLSGAASKALGLIDRINKIKDVTDEIDKYPELKNTTATLPGTYTLKIDPTVPPVVHGPRRQPQALAEKIKAKLNEMEEKGPITKVTTPTDWVCSMVVVTKQDKVRTCLDPKD